MDDTLVVDCLSLLQALVNLHNTVARSERSNLRRTVFKYAIASRKSTFRKWSRKILRLSRHQCTDSASNLIQSKAMALDLGVNFTLHVDTTAGFQLLAVYFIIEGFY